MRVFMPLLAFLLIMPLALSAAEVTGKVRVIDGDSLRLAGHNIRLFGIDAPENDQTCVTRGGLRWDCGAEVTRLVREALEGETVTCDLRGKDDWDRDLAICHLGGRNLNAWLVEEGWAFAFRKYSMMFDLEEKSAAVNGRGLHAHDVQRPVDYRQEKRAQSKPPVVRRIPATDTGGCRIKGNISANGRIYHMPGQHDYERTSIRPDKGERWFCSEAEARAAGWRPARR
ncbi:thermonuclease family protein [Marimonas sp. MJW-29]|uniref:Thermonuclease family protein n=1 Tax=Sulfitobacter sediminis TaxID=3234186 RepID=A0ABV3RR29_9RHOB